MGTIKCPSAHQWITGSQRVLVHSSSPPCSQEEILSEKETTIGLQADIITAMNTKLSSRAVASPARRPPSPPSPVHGWTGPEGHWKHQLRNQQRALYEANAALQASRMEVQQMHAQFVAVSQDLKAANLELWHKNAEV